MANVTDITDTLKEKKRNRDSVFFHMAMDIKAGRSVDPKKRNRVALALSCSVDIGDQLSVSLDVFNDLKSGIVDIIKMPESLVGGNFRYIPFMQVETVVCEVLNFPNDKEKRDAFETLFLQVKDKHKDKVKNFWFSFDPLTDDQIKRPQTDT